MEHTHPTGDLEAATRDERTETIETVGQAVPAATGELPTATIAATTPTREDGTEPSASILTIFGHGTPSSFEVTVDGEIELLEETQTTTVTTLSGSTVEGTIETGTIRFQFTGDLTDVTFVDRRITGLSPAAAPNVHVDYSSQ